MTYQVFRGGDGDGISCLSGGLYKIFEERGNLSEEDEAILYKERIVIPSSLGADIIESIHTAHQQGCSSIEARAAKLLWCPRLRTQIETKRR